MTCFLAIIIIALTCATLHAQSVSIQASGPGDVMATGAGNVAGVVILLTYTNYSDGRFTIWNTNQDVVIDNDSSLMWTRNANLVGQTNWYAGTNWAAELDYAGYDDWRLPSITEFSRDEFQGATNGLFDDHESANDPALPLGHPFASIQSVYWSSTTYAGDTNNAWFVYTVNGYVGTVDSKSTRHYVWPCRGP